MIKAFMRGVCALNMEAMNMLYKPDPDSVEHQGYSLTNADSNRENATSSTSCRHKQYVYNDATV